MMEFSMLRSMHVMALTGGIASGKSTVCRFLREFLPSIVIFDCDTVVHRLLEADPEVASIITETFGQQALDAQGRIDRHFLRGRVFSDPEARMRLEAILHPRVKQECLDSMENAATNGAECSSRMCRCSLRKGSISVRITCLSSHPTVSTQIQRLKARGGFEDSLIESILAAQLPVHEKISLRMWFFGTRAPQAVIRSQIRRFAQALLMSLSPESASAPEPPPSVQRPVPVPVAIDINQFRLKSLTELQAMAEALPARIQGGIPKSQLVYELLSFLSHEGTGLGLRRGDRADQR
jgi:transcription termination factor Rho